MKRLILIACLLSGVAYAGNQNCPQDGQMLIRTGATQVAFNGRLMFEYRCALGHTYWIVE